MIMSAYGVNTFVFLGLQVAMGFLGGLWVAKLGFGRLKVIIGGYKWLCPRYAQYMSKICTRYAQDMLKICQRYAQDMNEICPRYAQDMTKICPRYAQDMHEICTRNA